MFLMIVIGIHTSYLDGKHQIFNGKSITLQPLTDREIYLLYALSFLVLIPVIIAFISMIFLMSVFTSNIFYILLASTIYSLIILSIERFIIASSFNDTGKEDQVNKTVKLASRFIFSIIISFTLSHPLLLHIFKDVINQKLEKQKLKSVSNVSTFYNKSKTPLEKKLTALNLQKECINKQLNSQMNNLDIKLPCGNINNSALRALKQELSCIQLLINAEGTGIKKHLSCGVSSGREGFSGPNTKNLFSRKKLLLQEIKKSENKNNQKVSILKSNLLEIQSKINRLEKKLDKIIVKEEIKTNKFEANYGGYISRYKALEKLKKEDDDIYWISMFVMILLMALDLLPVLLKSVTKFPVIEGLFLEEKKYHSAQKILNQHSAFESDFSDFIEEQENYITDINEKIKKNKAEYEEALENNNIIIADSLERIFSEFIKQKEDVEIKLAIIKHQYQEIRFKKTEIAQVEAQINSFYEIENDDAYLNILKNRKTILSMNCNNKITELYTLIF